MRKAARAGLAVDSRPDNLRARVHLVIPLLPPSANSYARHSAGTHYVTREVEAFKDAVALLARGEHVRADAYRVEMHVFLGAGKRGDLDNFAKVGLDSLQYAGVIDTDAKIVDLHMTKGRDAANPRTVITVEAWSRDRAGE